MLKTWSYSPSPNRLRHSWLRMPLLGAARISQAIAPRKGGVTKGGRDEGANELAVRQVGARDQPSERQRCSGGPEGDADGNLDRRQVGGCEGRIDRETDEVGRRWRALVVGDAVPEQPSQRQQNEAAQNQR